MVGMRGRQTTDAGATLRNRPDLHHHDAAAELEDDDDDAESSEILTLTARPSRVTRMPATATATATATAHVPLLAEPAEKELINRAAALHVASTSLRQAENAMTGDGNINGRNECLLC